jgi:Fic family protein
MNKPPYTITEKAADYLAKITEAITRLELGTGFKRDIRLHRRNRVRSIHSSLAIEGNTLSLEDVTTVIGGKLVAGKQVEIKEVKNAYAAYDLIMTFNPNSAIGFGRISQGLRAVAHWTLPRRTLWFVERKEQCANAEELAKGVPNVIAECGFNPYQIGDFLKAHKLMTDGLVKESGCFRSGNVGVYDGAEVVHVGARPQFVPQLMRDLFAWGETSDLHPLLKSGVMHYEIETIHPFADGNGRMGRLWQTLLLGKWNVLFSWIPMETVLFKQRAEYYEAIRNARKTNDSGVFIGFTLSVLHTSVVEQIKARVNEEVNERVNVKVNANLSEKEKTLLSFLSKNGTCTLDQMAAKLSLSKKTVSKHIKALKVKGRIRRVGSDKVGHWKVIANNDINEERVNSATA